MFLKYRRFVTSSVGFAFLVVGTTGVIFKLFFKTHTLEEIHGWLGLFLVTAALLHMAQNWESLWKYVRDKRVLALTIPILMAIAFLTFKPEEKRRGVNPRVAMQRLANGSVANVARAFGQDVSLVVSAMKSDGLQVVNADDSIARVAQANGKKPGDLFIYFVKQSRD